MRTYYLKYKISGDLCYKITAVSIEQAIKFFAKMKNLNKDSLLNVFIITDQL